MSYQKDFSQALLTHSVLFAGIAKGIGDETKSMSRPKKKQRLEASKSQSAGTLTAPASILEQSDQSEVSSGALQHQPLHSASSNEDKSSKKKRKGRSLAEPHKSPKKNAGPAKQLEAVQPADLKTQRRSEQKECKSDRPDLQPHKRPADWWGASKFVTGGCLGGLNDQEPSKARKSFTEDTQEQLYLTTHAAKTAGKKGLGAGQGQSHILSPRSIQ